MDEVCSKAHLAILRVSIRILVLHIYSTPYLFIDIKSGLNTFDCSFSYFYPNLAPSGNEMWK